MSFLLGGVSGGQALAMLVKRVSQNAGSVVAGMRDLDSRMKLLILLLGVL